MVPFISLVLASTALIALGLPPFQWGILAWVGLVPIFVLVYQGTSKKQVFLAGTIFGSLYMGAVHHWVLFLGQWTPLWLLILAWLVIASLLSLFYGFAFLGLRYVKDFWFSPFLFAAIWTAFEYLRSGMGAFADSGGVLGYLQVSVPWILPLATIGGVYLLSFLLVFFNAWLARSLVRRKWRQWGIPVFLVFIFSLSFFSAHYFQLLAEKTIRIGVAQGNHSEDEKMDSAKWPTIADDYLRLSEIAENRGADLVFWPETALPTLLLEWPSIREKIRNYHVRHSAYLVFGIPTRTGSSYFNSVVSMSACGVTQVYQKIRLIPFGEYFPARRFLNILKWVPHSLVPPTFDEGFSRGPSPAPLLDAGLPLGVGICLEIIDQGHFRHLSEAGAQLLFMPANNAWYGESGEPEEALQIAKLRAIENGRFLVVAANTGISAVISPKGQIIQRIPLNQRDVIVSTVGLFTQATPFVRWGYLLVPFLIFCGAVAILVQSRYNHLFRRHLLRWLAIFYKIIR